MTLPDEVQLSCTYRPIAEIGRGGMGEVCLAVAHGVAGFKKLVVLKRARPDLADEPQVLAMFLDEARLAARLNHPNVVQTYEAGRHAGRYFIAMEYLDGQPLNRIRARVGPRGFPLSMQIRILIEALAGLHHAHELADFDGSPFNVVHRDVTPQNLFVTYDGQIKVVDFGIAKAKSSTIKTRAGMIRGKVPYMAPEQARSEPLDRRVDIFAVGIMLWEAMAGERMWKNVSDTEIIRRLVTDRFPRLPAEAPHADPELARICDRALAPERANRYATAMELQHELERWLAQKGEEVTARAVGTFVAAHFEEERAVNKALLEHELRDCCSIATVRKVLGAEKTPLEFEQTLVEGNPSSRLPVASSSESAITVTAPAEASPLPAPITMRSPQTAAVSTSAFDGGSLSPDLPFEDRETLPQSPASISAVAESLPVPPSPGWRLRPVGLGIAALIMVVVAGVPLAVTVALQWSSGRMALPPDTMASVNSLVLEESTPAASGPARVRRASARPAGGDRLGAAGDRLEGCRGVTGR
jgi:serine/threonine protein kinase